MAIDKKEEMTPVHLFSHGSTMMLGEKHHSARYWKKCGDEALANGVEHIIMMGAHWATSYVEPPSTTSPASGPGIIISAHPNPDKSPVAYVEPSKYVNYELNPDLPMASRCQDLFAAAGIPSKLDPEFDWIHDTYLVLIRMFPKKCPPTTLISMNHCYDPHFHMAVGAALRPLRAASEKTLFIGSGGAVHNLYRNVWAPMLRYRDNFAQPTPPEEWALGFRHEVLSAVCSGCEEDLPRESSEYGKGWPLKSSKPVGGPMLRRKVASLMKHPLYREAHATDDHFMATMFVAGLCGDKADEGMVGEMGAEDWELTNMCNSQFTIGKW